MSVAEQTRTILMVDDDAEDCMLVRDAIRETGRRCELRFVRDGEELDEYIHRTGEYEQAGAAPRPDLILMDLKMPRKDGRDTLRDLKADASWRRIPVIVLTSSAAEDDVDFCYSLGVNSYFRKPSNFRDLVALLDMIGKYWFELSILPPRE